jgi:LPS O-antigen subunit length determinant protein (WzzB/FepE family)
MTSNSSILTNISSNAPQIFMQGYEYLDAQISSLSIRTNVDPFIPKLRSLQDQLNMLKNDEQISALKKRKNDDPFIPELPTLLAEIKLLDHNPKIEQLEKRKNDDPYIASLRDMESTLSYLKSIHIDPKSFLSARLDKSASPPEYYIKPKRKLIVVLSFVLGLMIGVFMAFVMNFRENIKKPDN